MSVLTLVKKDVGSDCPLYILDHEQTTNKYISDNTISILGK